MPWGMEDIEGEIIDVYVSGLGPRARVRLVQHQDESIVTVPLDTLVRVGASSAGGRVQKAHEYEQMVRAALSETLDALDPSSKIIEPPDKGVDAAFQSKNRTLFVQVKSYAPGHKVSSDAVAAAAGLVDRRSSALLVTNVPLTIEARRRLEHLHHNRKSIWHVLWRGPDDNTHLATQTRHALSRFK